MTPRGSSAGLPSFSRWERPVFTLALRIEVRLAPCRDSSQSLVVGRFRAEPRFK
jgi:hypothetical protein